MEIAAGHDGVIGEDERIVGDRVRFDFQRAADRTQEIEARAVDLRLATNAIRVLDALVTLDMALADNGAGEQMAQQLGIASQVSFLGVRQDVPALLTAADGFVLSSAWEGMPNVVMEALAAGTPVVATRVGGVSELVEPRETGFLVPPKDPPALAEAMRQLMSLPLERRREMGVKGQHHVATRYSLQAMGERWMALYAELLTRKALPTPSAAQAVGSLR